MKLFLLILLLPAFAFPILPLPYTDEPVEDESKIILDPIVRDVASIPAYQDLQEGSKSRDLDLPRCIDNNLFKVPKELQSRVDFWKKIYSEYTSREAVLHDSFYPEIIYEVVDLSAIANDESYSYQQRAKLINKALKIRREKIEDNLKFIHATQHNPSKIPAELFSLFKKFESIKEKNKFLAASDRVRAQVGQREQIVRGLFFGGRYFKRMMEILEKKGVPQELSRLPLVESAFNLNARSKVGASGVWQFMHSTGKLFMKVDKAVDERNDPITATWAAADLLLQNYEALDSWPLAITAYNHGREGMARAVRSLGTSSLPEIIKNYKSKTFGFASSNFYSEFLAILEVEKEYRAHFGKIKVDAPIEFEEVVVVTEANFPQLADQCQVDPRQLWELNPSLTDWVTSGNGNIPQTFRLKVPVGKKQNCKNSTQVVQNFLKH